MKALYKLIDSDKVYAFADIDYIITGQIWLGVWQNGEIGRVILSTDLVDFQLDTPRGRIDSVPREPLKAGV